MGRPAQVVCLWQRAYSIGHRHQAKNNAARSARGIPLGAAGCFFDETNRNPFGRSDR